MYFLIFIAEHLKFLNFLYISYLNRVSEGSRLSKVILRSLLPKLVEKEPVSVADFLGVYFNSRFEE